VTYGALLDLSEPDVATAVFGMLRDHIRWDVIAPSARIAVFAASAAATLWVSSVAAERASNPRLVGTGTGAGTMDGALILAYRNNPQLNAQRSATRATDENVPTALAGYRPRISGTSSLTEQYLDTLTKVGTTAGGAAVYNQNQGATAVSSFGLTTTQTLFNGSKPPIAPARQKDRYSPRARCCGPRSRALCSTPPPPT